MGVQWLYNMILEALLILGLTVSLFLLLLCYRKLKIADGNHKTAAARYHVLFGSVADAILVHPLDENRQPGNYIEVNDSAIELLGYSRDELMRKSPINVTVPPGIWDNHGQVTRLLSDGSFVYEQTYRSSDGNNIPVRVSSCISRFRNQNLIFSTIHDLTEKKRLENEVRHSQRMESIGRLAGGVAHDFNNILTVINGYTDLMINTMTQENQFYSDVIEIRDAAERAVSLTQQLLAFSRKQVLRPRSLLPQELLERVDMLLRRVIGEDIKLSIDVAGKTGTIHADPTQLEQVIINLAVNARDAMPEGGILKLRAATAEICDSSPLKRPEILNGPYVLIECEDSGIGMDENTAAHIFEPFFTTKERGKGTGLGLSTAYGTVKQSGGYIYPVSEPNKGTTFQLLFPDVSQGQEPGLVLESEKMSEGGSETILLVEDEASVREYVTNILSKKGYDVYESRDGDEALQKARELGGRLDLVISDIVMPKINGPELLEELSEINPAVKMLFITGYADDALIQSQLPPDYWPILAKPFASGELLALMRKVLDEL